MATITIASAICAGGNHAHSTLQLNAGPQRQVTYDAPALRVTPTAEELMEASRILLRAHLMGMTAVQARNAMLAGITISVGAT